MAKIEEKMLQMVVDMVAKGGKMAGTSPLPPFSSDFFSINILF